jgi:hypothetical protein
VSTTKQVSTTQTAADVQLFGDVFNALCDVGLGLFQVLLHLTSMEIMTTGYSTIGKPITTRDDE